MSDWSPGWPTVGQVVARGIAAYGAREAVVDGARRLAGYKLPRRLTVLEALPRTGSGKITKAELRRRAAQDAPDG